MLFARGRLLVLASLFAAVLAAGILAACGGGDDDNTSASPTGAASTDTPAETLGTAPACPPAGGALSLRGSGATFPGQLYEQWFAQYRDLCHLNTDYTASSSASGISQLVLKNVDFAASDAIMTDTQKTSAHGTVHHIPMTSETIAVIYNITGVPSAGLTLDGQTLADIFQGKITKWDDPAIVALNSGVTLPATDISVVYRADVNDGNALFTSYLSANSIDWQSAVGSAPSVQWPAGTGEDGNSGVANQVQQTEGAIGYVSLSYAKQNNVPVAKLKNKAGNAIEPSIASALAAQDGVTFPDDMEYALLDGANANAYPIVGFSWLLVSAEQVDKAKAESLGHLIKWMLTDGQQSAESLNYVPLSAAAAQKALAELDATTFEGTPILNLQ
jgi:phosphate transport system substrate-binding protein